MNYLSRNVFVFPYISPVSHSLLQRIEFPGCVTWFASCEEGCRRQPKLIEKQKDFLRGTR